MLSYFEKLDIPFEACKACCLKYCNYVEEGDWLLSPNNEDCDKCYGFSIQKILSKAKYINPIVCIPNSIDAPGMSLSYQLGKLSNELWSSAWKYAINRFVHKSGWTVSNVKEYFKLFCLNYNTTSNFIN